MTHQTAQGALADHITGHIRQPKELLPITLHDTSDSPKELLPITLHDTSDSSRSSALHATNLRETHKELC
jgi:hypothetical protein